LSPSPDSQLLAQTLKPTAKTSQSFGFLDSQLQNLEMINALPYKNTSSNLGNIAPLYNWKAPSLLQPIKASQSMHSNMYLDIIFWTTQHHWHTNKVYHQLQISPFVTHNLIHYYFSLLP
jgi:hypothetical protein